jgi:predicted CXXCH cytochrome family protein
MTTHKFILYIAILLILGISYSALAQSENCVEGKCHSGMTEKRWVHGPVGANICTICHELETGEKHKFKFAAEEQELCFLCHEDKRESLNLKHQHSPVANGDCTGCHDPHQSDFRYQLHGEGANLCYKCHDQDEFNKKFQHGPIQGGDCNACHNPHASENSFQLIASRDNICYVCHPDKESEVNSKHPHPPVQEDCLNCHNPHSDVAEFMLSEKSPEMCFQCHDNIESKMTASTPHPPVAKGECAKCHQIHGSANPKLFIGSQEEMCYNCHDKIKDQVVSSSSKHGPVNEGDCIACHDGHGSDQPLMLQQYFPKEFYNPYSTDRYALCFNCHNKDIALDSVTTTLTDFRDGDVNLHYKHINKQIKGRSCKACHEVHVSNQDKHIRQSVPFGKSWSYPILFTIEEDGGNCVVGCHKPQEYKRSRD